MELIWKEIETSRLIARRTEQTHISGVLPPPEGRKLMQVLNCSAEVYVVSCTVEKESVTVEGRIDANVTALDGNEAFSFRSSAGFRHSMNMPEAMNGMTAQVMPVIQTLYAAPSPEGAELKADVDLETELVCPIPLKVIGGVSGVGDLEMKIVKETHRSLVKIADETLHLREEIAAEGAARIVSCEGFAAARELTTEGGTASVSGIITISAVTADKEDRLLQTVRQIPFREKLSLDGAGRDAFCTAELRELYLRTVGDDLDLISMEAEVGFVIYAAEIAEAELPVDAFSPEICFDCLREKPIDINRLGGSSFQISLREEVPLPDNAPEPSRGLFAAARPIVTGTEIAGEQMKVTGVFETTAVYESEAGNVNVFIRDVPFECALPCPPETSRAKVKPRCVCSLAGIAERNALLQYSLLLNAEFICETAHELVVGLAEREPDPRREGLIVCFASEGESVFDIAKRYRVPCDTVRNMNPEIEEPLHEGEKLIMIV